MSDLATPWTTAHPAPSSMGFPRQGHWSGLPFPSPNLYISNGVMGEKLCSHCLVVKAMDLKSIRVSCEGLHPAGHRALFYWTSLVAQKV